MEWKPPWHKENIWLKRLTFSREVANPRTEEIHTIDFEVWKKLEDGSWAEVALSNRGDTLKSLGVHLDLLEPRDNKRNRLETFHRLVGFTFLLPERLGAASS